jgi:hypothetical protein
MSGILYERSTASSIGLHPADGGEADLLFLRVRRTLDRQGDGEVSFGYARADPYETVVEDESGRSMLVVDRLNI